MFESPLEAAPGESFAPPRVHWDDPTWPANVPSMEVQGRAIERAVAEVWAQLPEECCRPIAQWRGCIHIIPDIPGIKEMAGPSCPWDRCEGAGVVCLVPIPLTVEPDHFPLIPLPIVVHAFATLMISTIAPLPEERMDHDWSGLWMACGEVLILMALPTPDAQRLLATRLEEMGPKVCRLRRHLSRRRGA